MVVMSVPIIITAPAALKFGVTMVQFILYTQYYRSLLFLYMHATVVAYNTRISHAIYN